MKQISVNDNCSGCGLCIINSKYLKENAEGNAEPILGKAIKNEDLKKLKNLINECPEHALSIIEVKSTSKKGKDGITDIINKLNDFCDNFTVKKITSSDIKLNPDEYKLEIPLSIKENRMDYPSESSARSAAKDEFNRLCYSESAYRPMLKKIFVEYKVRVLKPYYTCTDTEDSIYYTYNQQIRTLLSNIYAEANEIIEKSNNIPASWKEFSVYPSQKDIMIEVLNNFDERSTSSGIITALKDLSSTSLNDYVSYMDFDYSEMYAGEGLFGKTKYKNMWYFSNFKDAAKSFIDDLSWAVGYMSSDIVDSVVKDINYLLSDFEKKIKDELKIKIFQLKKNI